MQIKKRDGQVAFEGTFRSVKQCVHAAVKAEVDLRLANLTGAERT